MESTGIHSLKVCRDLNYYVDPLSESILELGTFEFPYKNINLVLIEVFNYISPSYKTITVHLSDAVTHVVDHDLIMIYGVDKLVFDLYNANGIVKVYGMFLFTNRT